MIRLTICILKRVFQQRDTFSAVECNLFHFISPRHEVSSSDGRDLSLSRVFFSKLLQANCVKRELKIICTLKAKLILGRRKDVGSCFKCLGLFFPLPLQILTSLTVCVCLLFKRMSRIHKKKKNPPTWYVQFRHPYFKKC